VGRLERAIECRDAVESAGQGDLGNRLLAGLRQETAALGVALRSHDLGKADTDGLEQDVQMTNGNPEQIRHEPRGKR